MSERLRNQIRERSVEPVTIDVSEFLAKGGGSVKCMILDLGPSTEQPRGGAAQSFRIQRSYPQVFPSESA
ncbi:MAG: arginine deiminase-related protein [Candidatus Binataceae bacterium]